MLLVAMNDGLVDIETSHNYVCIDKRDFDGAVWNRICVAVWPLKEAQCCHVQSKTIWLRSLALLSWQWQCLYIIHLIILNRFYSQFLHTSCCKAVY